MSERKQLTKHTFSWNQPASEVIVTGSFDDWKQTIKLEPSSSGGFAKEIELPGGKIYYKYLVDGKWSVNTDAPQETDGAHMNNVVFVPLNTPGSYASKAREGARRSSEFGDNNDTTKPLRPGDLIGHPGREEGTFGVNPLPPTGGSGANPIKLAPGEPIPPPDSLTTENVQSNVRTDKEAYEADASHPAFAKNVPEVVRHSFDEAHVSPEAATNPQTVQEKEQVAGEVQSTVPTAPDVHQLPASVEHSYNQSQISREAEANPDAIGKHSTVKDELLQNVPHESTTVEGEGSARSAGNPAEAAAGERPGTSATNKTSRTIGEKSTASSKKKRRPSWWQRLKNKFI